MEGRKTVSVVACDDVNVKEDDYNDALVVGRCYQEHAPPAGSADTGIR